MVNAVNDRLVTEAIRGEFKRQFLRENSKIFSSFDQTTLLNIPKRTGNKKNENRQKTSRSQAYVSKRNGGSGDENGKRNTRVKPLRMRNISIFKIAASQQERLFFFS